MAILKIFQTANINGSVLHQYHDEVELPDDAYNVGLSAIKTLVNERCGDHKLLIDTGDMYCDEYKSMLGSYLVNNNIKEPSLVECCNQIGYDVMTPGDGDFNYTSEYLVEQFKQFKGDTLCANLTIAGFDIEPYKIFDFDGCKVAVIGLIDQNTAASQQIENLVGCRFEDVIETYRKYEQELTAQSDIIIVNYHGGFEADLETGELLNIDQDANHGYRLVKMFASIDICFAANSAAPSNCQVNDTICMQPQWLGVAVSEITIDTKTKQIIEHQLVKTRDYPMDYNIRCEFNTLTKESRKKEEQRQLIYSWFAIIFFLINVYWVLDANMFFDCESSYTCHQGVITQVSYIGSHGKGSLHQVTLDDEQSYTVQNMGRDAENKIGSEVYIADQSLIGDHTNLYTGPIGYGAILVFGFLDFIFYLCVISAVRKKCNFAY